MGDLSRWQGLTQAQRVIVGDGDSLIRGTAHATNGFFAQLQVGVGQYFLGAPGKGFQPIYLQTALDPDDPRYTFADTIGDWPLVTVGSVDDQAPYGLTYARGVVTTPTQAIRYARVTGETIHHFDLAHTDTAASGDIDVSIDNGAYFTVTTAKAHDHALKQVTVNKPVTSNIRIRPHLNTTLSSVGVSTWERTLPPQGCAAHNLGKDASHTYEFDRVSASGNPYAIHDLLNPDLAIGLWTNDFTLEDHVTPGTGTVVTVANLAAAVARFGVHLQAIYNDHATRNTDVLFIVPYQQQRNLFGRTLADDETIQAALRQKIIDVANANLHADYLDVYSQFPPHAADAISQGLLNADGLHPTQAGHDIIYGLLYAKVVGGATRATPAQLVVTAVDSNALLDHAIPGIRVDGFVFNLTDAARQQVGVLEVSQSSVPTVRNDTTRTSLRTVDGLRASNKPSDLDLRRHRLQVMMVLQNGTQWPLGIFMFGQNDTELDTAGDIWTPSLFDENFILDQGLDRTWSFTKGASQLGMFTDMAQQVLGPLGIPTDYSVSDSPTSSPGGFVVGSSRLVALRSLAASLGCFPPFFANDGTHTLKQAPVVTAQSEMDHVYEAGGRIFAHTIRTSDTLYRASNTYIVTGSELSAGVPVRGVYTLPSTAPHSLANVGYEITAPVHSVPGVSSAEVAAQIAYIDALTDKSQYRTATFEAMADPRHDTFETCQLLGEKYIEQAWSLACTSGGHHGHELAGLWIDAVAAA